MTTGVELTAGGWEAGEVAKAGDEGGGGVCVVGVGVVVGVALVTRSLLGQERLGRRELSTPEIAVVTSLGLKILALLKYCSKVFWLGVIIWRTLSVCSVLKF